MEIGDQNGAEINEKQGSDEKNKKSEKQLKNIVLLMFLEQDSKLVTNRDFHY